MLFSGTAITPMTAAQRNSWSPESSFNGGCRYLSRSMCTKCSCTDSHPVTRSLMGGTTKPKALTMLLDIRRLCPGTKYHHELWVPFPPVPGNLANPAAARPLEKKRPLPPGPPLPRKPPSRLSRTPACLTSGVAPCNIFRKREHLQRICSVGSRLPLHDPPMLLSLLLRPQTPHTHAFAPFRRDSGGSSHG